MGHVNVPCKLQTCWMLRNCRVRVGWGMLTFLVGCAHVGRYATEETDAAAADDLYDPQDASDDAEDDDAQMMMMVMMMMTMMMKMMMMMMT